MGKTIKKPVNVNFCGGELQNFKFQNLTTAPTGYTEGMPYMDTVNHIPKYHNGTELVEFGRIYTNGDGIFISSSNVVSINNSVTGGTKCKVTYNNQGLVTAGDDLSASDIPDISATYVTTSLLGANSGVATLGSDGKVPSSQLPAYVDDVIELLTIGSEPSTCDAGDKYYNTTSKKIFTATATNTWGTTGADPVKDVIYVNLATNGSYRWGGSDMINIANPISAASESTAGIAELATQNEVNTGTDDNRIVTPLKLATYTNGMAKKFAVNNTALTASGGGVTWNITNSLSTKDVQVSIYDTSTGEQIFPAVTVAQTSPYGITVEMLASSDVSADTYRAVVVG